MRSLVYIIFLIFLSLFSCDEQVGVDNLSTQDEEALLAIQKEISNVALYNDSLANYINLTGVNNDAQCEYFDDHYHYHDSLYSMHHEIYSHSYGWDDHTMGNGGMMGQNHNMTGNFPGGMGHYQNDHDFMDSLHIAHEPYHFSGE